MQNLLNEGAVDDTLPLAAGSYRIGGVSRLSGVPVATLRVWEKRYVAFSPAKSTGRHRLYVESDVTKARLMRLLTASGHSVGAIARLPVNELQRLLAGASAESGPAPVRPPRVSAIVVGDAIAARLQTPQWRRGDEGESLDVRQVYASLEEAIDGEVPLDEAPPADLLLVRLNAVNVSAHRMLARAIEHHRVSRAILLYNFGAEPLLAAIRTAGVLVRREPLPDAELVELIRSLKVVNARESMGAFSPGAAIPRRRYSEALLARVAAAPTSIVCECPRHLADLINQLASFEAYSEQCLHDSAEDARLHAYLRSISGSARALFEHALHLVAQHGGTELQDDLTHP
ncbi:MerR family transcriptional regulator [Ramlibacter sp. Leaf400]|uniref:MerR family transcriptional regulator n=1 Tax=Ramlibacter sp. Leaf400 TaxID=1736365 RepID=UPI0006FEE43C|nr:MerR family transcriptional regulator [Ramlibacter sp. Leaf400]KQT09747.1 hypothetical protein ASG30_14510 [Ramlibacter sp. Leaf400]